AADVPMRRSKGHGCGLRRSELVVLLVEPCDRGVQPRHLRVQRALHVLDCLLGPQGTLLPLLKQTLLRFEVEQPAKNAALVVQLWLVPIGVRVVLADREPSCSRGGGRLTSGAVCQRAGLSRSLRRVRWATPSPG